MIRIILISSNVSGAPLITCNTFTNEMVRNTLCLLLQLRFRNSCITQYRLVISIDISRTNDRYAHHTQLVSQSTDIFTTQFHRTKLTSKTTRLHQSLLLRKSVYQGTIEVHQET